MTRMTLDEIWMEVAVTISKRSRCSRARIGAVIIDNNKRIMATGYNGPAATYDAAKNGYCIDWCERAKGLTNLSGAYDGCPSIHAEANALLFSDRAAIRGATIYITSAPCMQCAKLISNSGILKVVTIIRAQDTHRSPETAIEYLRNCNIEVTVTEDVNDK